MATNTSDSAFAGAIPQLYDELLVPLIFAPYAADLARRAAARAPERVLEVAAGTGAVTRELARVLPPNASIVATDLNPAMLARAATVGFPRPVELRPADAMQLPFEDGSFDAVVCQFGVMFFPDKARALAEARRVLRPGGALLFNVWDRLERNDFPRLVDAALARVFPADPPRFLARVPYAYFEREAIERDLRAGGFERDCVIETLGARSRAASARIAATALCQGTPLRAEIEARGAPGLAVATDAAADAIAREFGTGAVNGAIQALVVVAER